MRGYLLDTNVILRATAQPNSLASKIRRALERGPNYVSVVSYWEVVLKSMKGKLHVGDFHVWWDATRDQLAATAMPLRAEHVSAIAGLPSIHQDPFDRALIAQAQVEELTMITTDSAIAEYARKGFHVLR